MKEKMNSKVFLFALLFFLTGCGTNQVSNSNADVTPKPTMNTTTEKPMQKVEKVSKNTVIFECNTNEKNTPGYQSVEEVSPDSFYISGEYIFLDDTVNQRILVYKDGDYKTSWKLDWNYNVKQMYYDEEQKVLKTVYEDLSCSDGPVYYLMELNGENGSILSQQKLSDSNHVLLNYYFTEDGELDTFFMNDEERNADTFSALQKFFSKDFEFTICSSDKSCMEKVVVGSNLLGDYDNGMVDREIIVRMRGDEMATYAIPQQHQNSLHEGLIKQIHGNIYQLALSKNHITIYLLAEKQISGEHIEYYDRKIK